MSRTILERTNEVMILIGKLTSLGFKNTDSGMVIFIKHCNEFIKMSKQYSDTITFTEHPYKLVVVLCIQKNTECSVTIKKRY